MTFDQAKEIMLPPKLNLGKVELPQQCADEISYFEVILRADQLYREAGGDGWIRSRQVKAAIQAIIETINNQNHV